MSLRKTFLCDKNDTRLLHFYVIKLTRSPKTDKKALYLSSKGLMSISKRELTYNHKFSKISALRKRKEKYLPLFSTEKIQPLIF